MFIFIRHRKFNATKGGKARHVKYNATKRGKARITTFNGTDKIKIRHTTFNKHRLEKFHETLESKWNKECKYGCGYIHLDSATPGMLNNCCYEGINNLDCLLNIAAI